MPLVMIESFTADREKDVWNDFCVIFAKPSNGALIQRELISDQFPCRNVRLHGVPTVSRESWETEDMILLEEARRKLGGDAAIERQPSRETAAARPPAGAVAANGASAPFANKLKVGAAASPAQSPDSSAISTAELLAMSVAFRTALSDLREGYSNGQLEVQHQSAKPKRKRT
jgi:hypothetical protein